MKIKKGDTIKVMSGKDKGKSGKVLQAFPKLGRVSVEGVNISFKHLRGQKSKQRTQGGQKIEFPSPIRIDAVALVCPRCGKFTRVSFKLNKETKKKDRICRKCKEVI